MSDYKTPKDKLITNEKALALNNCYKEKHLKEFEVSNDGSFCCSAWYSLEDLQGYINYVKEQAKAQEINVDGIRFYFGVYPEGDAKEGQNTLFMCPTKSTSATISESGRSRGEEVSDDDSGGDSEDVTTISAMNYGNGGNPPVNTYGG
ncbi:MAG: hypothetical protein AAF611_22910 [Bacteroidota bacterium]